VRGYTPPPPGLGLNDVSNEFTGRHRVSAFEKTLRIEKIGLNIKRVQLRYD
jgi:hypothetical protein